MTKQKEEIDHFGHVYADGQKIDFEGNIMLLIGKFLTEVIQNETGVFAPFTYTVNAQEIKNEDGELIRVEAEHKEHSKTSFMLTATSDDGALLGLSPIGVKASQILSGILHLHEQNIKNNLAKKVEDIITENAFKA